jgi:hypothetical protein
MQRTMQVDDARGSTLARRSVIVLGFGCLLTFGARAQTPASPFDMRTEKCPALQDVFESLQADAIEAQARQKPGMPHEGIRRDILERLEKADLDSLETFFKCFAGREGQVSEADRRLGVCVLTAHIVAGYVDAPTTPKNPGETVKLPILASVGCHQKADGTRWCHGRYEVE